MSAEVRPERDRRGWFAFLLATAAICGALVMVVEVLGSRVIGPFFGVSLFVWTALITVALLALALGYAFGGWLADRRPHPSNLYALIGLAGVAVLLVPWLKAPVLEAALPLGLRAGAFASATVLFGPALFLLGCVSPYVVKIAADEWGRLGRTVGLLYAISTTGSFVGTVSTGYLLIGYVGVARAFFACGVALLTLAALYFALFARRPAALAVPLLALAALPGATVNAVTLADGTRAQVLERRDSYYGSVRVVEYSYGERRTRELTIDGLVQGGVDPTNGLSIYEYSYLLEHLPRSLVPDGQRALVIGLGAGIVPSWYHAQGVPTDVVDIDPEVVEVARRHFGFPATGKVYVEDARTFLGRAGERYDYVILDVFNGDTTPGHLVSVEALRLLKARVAEGGVVAINLMGTLRGDTAMTDAVLHTLGSVFAHLRLYPLFDPAQGEGAGNMVILAADRVLDGARLPADAPIHPFAEALVRRAAANPLVPRATPEALLLTDDFNPLDARDVHLKERVRRDILRTTPAAILLSHAGQGGQAPV